MNYSQRIYTKLLNNYNPKLLEVVNESHKHKGHIEHDESGETHFHIIISADIFEGKSKVTAHRMIYDVLKDELKEQVHALTIELRA